MFEPVRQTVVDRVTGIAWGLALAALMAGCDSRSGAGAASASAPASAAASAAPGPPPAEVGVVTVAPQTLGLSTELPGRLEASRVAQVRARAAGILQKRLFVEGSEVKAGQALFKIDAAPYQAAAASAQAALARTQANLTQAAAQAERYQPLAEAKAISQQEFIAAVAAHKQAQADVAAAKAALQVAQINLSQASVTSPISGRIGRALVTEGALVGQGEATALAVVQQVNPLYVNFTQSTADVLRLRKALGSGKLSAASAAQASSVRVVLEDGSEYPRVGKLLFSDLTVDASSGQVTLRAELPNPDGLLLPGMYVKVRIEQAQVNNGMLLPQQAVTRTAQGDSVMVVSPQGKVAPRPVKVGLAQGGQWLVTEGLQAGEQVMVDGFQKLRGPGLVKAVPWSAASASAASAPASATR
jgi:membrane fusion protein, multidrug efflux system